MDKRQVPSRLPSVDGWRAVSILMVLGGHTGLVISHGEKPVLDWLFNGNLGVRFFFSISGFLITWLLLLEVNKSGKISLKDFYARRFLRILPVYFTFMLALLGLQLFASFKETTAGWLGMLSFTRNYAEGSSASGHLWSLAVEEQFYLVWPSLFIFLARHSRRVKYFILAIPIFTAPAFRTGNYVFFHSHEHFLRGLDHIRLPTAFLDVFFYKNSFFCYYDTLAFGCLSAFLLANEKPFVEFFLKKWRGGVFVTGLLLVALPHVMGNLNRPLPPVAGNFLQVFGSTFQSMGFCLLLLQSLVAPDWAGYRVLNWKWIAWIGMLSYSLYIWQQLFCFQAWTGGELNQEIPADVWAWSWLIPTFAAAAASYYGLERPFLRLRSRFRHA